MGDGEGDVVGVGDGAAVVGAALDAVGGDAAGWVVHAVRRRAARSNTRIDAKSHAPAHEASELPI
jgi:hypothetical protein